jgi:surfactin synthase thioesterase subunit
MAESWVVDLAGRRDAPLQLIVFPHAGGSAAAFASWRRLLPEELQLRVVEAPGHGRRLTEAAYDDMEPLVAQLGPMLAPLLARPTLFFGHSLGAAVAFATTTWLVTQRQPLPLHLFVSGRRAPSCPRARPPVAHLDDAALRRELARLGGTPAAVLADAELMSVFLPAIRADLHISEQFSAPPTVQVPCPLTAMVGTEDAEVGVAEVDAWRHHAGGWFRAHHLPGHHFYLQERGGPVLDTVLRDVLDAADPGDLAADTLPT